MGVPAREMIALWNYDDDGITEIKVVRQKDQDSSTDRLICSAGACDEGWMDGNPSQTPLGLYAWLATFYGLKGHTGAERVLRQFAGVEGQREWVERLLNGLGKDLD